MTFPYVRVVGDVALIGLNSALPTPPGVAAGELGAFQRHQLARLLPALRERGLFRLVMIHHPPLPGQAGRLRGLRDAPELAALLAKHGSELVIHGHNHVDMLAWAGRLAGRDGAVARPPFPVVGAASASSARVHGREPLARYNIYDLSRGRGSTRWTIGRTIRGLVEPSGPVVELAADPLIAPPQ
jgi:3',5'-cyclic AMP phosphodiesterase CpdA